MATATKWIFLTIVYILMKTEILIQGQQVPCLFFFGDSLLDNGNNNGLITSAKANYPPYGIDYPGGAPTGRFANAENIADFIARLLDFAGPIPPFVTTRGTDILRGLNYASGAAGILEVSGAQLGDRFSMERQLLYHQATISRIAGLLGNRTAADRYLRQCLFVVNMGSNDYINNYYLPVSRSRDLYTPDRFAELLIQKFSQQLRKLYKLGTRKAAVFGLGLLGCIPQELTQYPPTNGSPCVDSINNAAVLFNNRLISLINDLNSNLPDAQFIYINVTSISSGDPSIIGIRVVNSPCCEVERLTGQCVRNRTPCSNRNQYAFFDNFHPTTILNNVTASRAYSALLPSDASPVDIRTLVQQ